MTFETLAGLARLGLPARVSDIRAAAAGEVLRVRLKADATSVNTT